MQSPYLQPYEFALAILQCLQEALSVPSSLLLRADHPRLLQRKVSDTALLNKPYANLLRHHKIV